jgi:hypothetical protein
LLAVFVEEVGVAISCDVIRRSGATPEQLAAVGAALWRWYSRSWGDAVLCQTQDNRGLADLPGGRPPGLHRTPRFARRRFVHLRVPDEAYPDAQATVDSLRQAISADLVEEVVVDGNRWALGGPRAPTPAAPPTSLRSGVRT